MRRAAVIVSAALLLAGCPIPQPLPDYPAGTITPPRILTSTTTRPSESIIPVPANCVVAPTYELGTRIFYPDNPTLVARWFVDYNKSLSSRYAIQNAGQEQVVADPDPLVLERTVPPFVFHPYGYPPAAELGMPAAQNADPGVLHVVELVVSNGFDTSPAAPEPNRTPAVTDSSARFEIQAFRWVFVNVAPKPGCDPSVDAICCPAP